METNEALALRAREGDREALAQLWQQVKYFAIQQSCRYTPTQRVSREDLIQCAYLGMHTAVYTYDSTRGCGFLHYMNFFLRRECQAALGLRGKPTFEADCSLDAQMRASESGTPLLALIGDDSIEDVNERIARAQLREAVQASIHRLPQRQAQLIRRYYMEGASMPQIARDLGLSAQRVQQVIEAARRHLRCDKKLLRFLREYGFTPEAPIKGQTKGKRARAQ